MALSANETYWFNGLPFTGIGTGSGTEVYWFQGLPFGFIEPAAAPAGGVPKHMDYYRRMRVR